MKLLISVSVPAFLVLSLASTPSFADNLAARQQQYKRDLELFRREGSVPDARPSHGFRQLKPGPFSHPTLYDSRCSLAGLPSMRLAPEGQCHG